MIQHLSNTGIGFISASDMGTIVEFRQGTEHYHEGYEVNSFAGNGGIALLFLSYAGQVERREKGDGKKRCNHFISL